MKQSTLLFLAALSAPVAAHVAVMLPLYSAPGGANMSPSWTAVATAANAHPNLQFYVVINPCNGPTNKTDVTGKCAIFNVDIGYNADFVTDIANLNNISNIQTIGYVSTNYNSGGRNRTLANVEADIATWANWTTGVNWSGQTVDIRVHGIWFDETSSDPANYAFYKNLTIFADQAFSNRSDPRYTKVLNVGVSVAAAYESQLFALGDAIITRETCWQDPYSNNTGYCTEPYTPYNVSTLVPGDGLPTNSSLNGKASIIVHAVQPDPPVNASILTDQIRRTVQLGIHSTYFTSDPLWGSTVAEPATVGLVANVVDASQP